MESAEGRNSPTAKPGSSPVNQAGAVIRVCILLVQLVREILRMELSLVASGVAGCCVRTAFVTLTT